MRLLMSARCVAALLALQLPVAAQVTHLEIDATGKAPAIAPVEARLGSTRGPTGSVLGANSAYLTLDGKPWLPVMGELHYSRVPEAEWESSILQMKAAGIEIISSYVIWIHHEQTEGQFVWNGNKDLRHFAELCAKHHMLFFPRLGPWAHGEVRNGGLPDWVVAKGHTRQNDPVYLAEVSTLYQQISEQLRGLYWKDGGPVIGVQIENEYRDRGEGKGDEHIRTLTQLARQNGIDVPFYTVTGWDGAAIPRDTVLPVFGGYPDAPWGDATTAVTGSDVYSFRFANRAAGNMGAIGAGNQSAASVYAGTPFLTAEVGGGIQETYFRRVTVSADDIAAIAPVMLGSGANLLGYYMFRGGRNPDGGAITLQESQRTGYPTDVPVKSYDFQAPLSANGEERESFRRLKLVHYFLQDFGDQMAPMAPHAPDRLPASTADLSVPRVAARTSGAAGYLFFNNYIRNDHMPDRKLFSVTLHLADETLTVPEKPITLPSGAYGIWPLNLDVGGTRLRYSTAQLFHREVFGGEEYFFFFAVPQIAPEFLFATDAQVEKAVGVRLTREKTGILLHTTAESSSFVLRRGSRKTHVIVLPRQQAENVWRLQGSGLLLTPSQFFADENTATLRNEGSNRFVYGLFGRAPARQDAPHTGRQGLFTMYDAQVPAVTLSAQASQLHAASPPQPWQNGPAVSWRKKPITLAPADADFARGASWTINVHGNTAIPSLHDVELRLLYKGDVARLEQGGRLLDDDFWDGLAWRVGLRQVAADMRKPFTLLVLPLPRPFPMYIQNRAQLPAQNPVLQLNGVEAVPVYEFHLPLAPAP